jgi:hypothetical protein
VKISIVYNYPIYGREHDDYALRFALTYHHFKPQIEHETILVANGDHPTDAMKSTMRAFGRFPNFRWVSRRNTAKDIGAYVDVAKVSTSDLLVFFGGSIFFWKPGWLERIADSVAKHGDTVYGTMVNSGDPGLNVAPHIRSTGFWMAPALLNHYPYRVHSDTDRYYFEHGQGCLTMWVAKRGLKPKLVTWDGEFDIPEWASAPESFHRGTQQGLLFKDRLAEPPFYA